jgi:hypothetical protein
MVDDVGDKPKGKGKKPIALSVVEGGSVVALARGQGRNPAGLTSKQEAFAQGVGRGLTLAQAYREAYDASGMAQASIHVEACKLMGNPLIAQRVNALVLERQAKTSLGSTRILAHVRERLMAESLDPDNSPSARIRALELLGRLGTVSAFDRTSEAADQSPAHDIAETLQARLQALLGKAS